MDQGLIHTFEGRVAICLVLAFLGLIVSCVLTFAFVLRKGAPLTTQINRVTGEKQHGIGWWFLGLAAVFVGPALLGLVIVTGVEVTNWLEQQSYFWPVLAASALMLGLGVWWFRTMRANRKPTMANLIEQDIIFPGVTPAGGAVGGVVPPAAVPQPGYFLPDDLAHDNADQWPR